MVETHDPKQTLESEFRLSKYSWEWKITDLSTVQKRIARAEVLARDRTKCFFCSIPIRPQDLHRSYDLHHLIPRGMPQSNFISNLKLAHRKCNANAGKPHPMGIQQTRERVNIEGMGVASSEETRRAVMMRPRWNNWIDTKPFTQFNLKKLARHAVHELGLGSSITWERYIREDAEGGILTIFEIEGVEQVRLNPDVDTRMLREQREREGRKFD